MKIELDKNLSKGDVKKNIIHFAIPLIICNLFQALYSAVDMAFVGRFIGTSALAAVSVSGPITNIIILTTSAMSVGVSVVIGKYRGREDFKNVNKSANTAIVLYLFMAIILTIFGLCFSEVLLKIVNTPERSMAQGVIYLKTIFSGSVFMCGYNLISALQRGLGDSKTSMRLIIIAGFCNIILNYVFVVIIGVGVIGSALATLISQGVSLILGILYFRINKHIISFRIKEIKIYPKLLKELIKIGVPNATQSLISNIAFITFTGIANGFGVAASAAFGIGIKIDTFAWMPNEAIGSSVAAFTSQNIGAGKPKRAIEGLKEASKIAVYISILVVGIVYISAPYLIKIFNYDLEVISYGTNYLRTGCFGYLISTLIHPCIGFIRGTGNSIKTIINVIISQYLLRIPVAYFLATYVGFVALPYASMVGTSFSAVVYIIFIKSGKWARSKGYRDMQNISNNKKPCTN